MKDFNKKENIDLNDIYTCFNWVKANISVDIPKNILVRVSETSRKNWTYSTDMNNIDITNIGENEVRERMGESTELQKYLPGR